MSRVLDRDLALLCAQVTMQPRTPAEIASGAGWRATGIICGFMSFNPLFRLVLHLFIHSYFGSSRHRVLATLLNAPQLQTEAIYPYR